jgi:hypothetical protein
MYVFLWQDSYPGVSKDPISKIRCAINMCAAGNASENEILNINKPFNTITEPVYS